MTKAETNAIKKEMKSTQKKLNHPKIKALKEKLNATYTKEQLNIINEIETIVISILKGE